MADVGGGAYPELRMTGLDAFAADAKEFAAAAADYEDRSRTYRRTAAELEATNSGATINEMVFAHHVRARKHEDGADVEHELAKGNRKIVELGHRMHACLDQIHHETQQEADAAGVLPGVRASIIAAGYARAVAAHNDFAAAMERVHAQTAANISQSLTFILGREIPKDQRDSTHALDNKTFGSRGENAGENTNSDKSTLKPRGEIGDGSTPDSASTGGRQSARQGMRGEIADAPSGPPGTEFSPRQELSNAPIEPTPLQMPRMSSPPVGGGSAGGGIPGGGLLGGGNPLSSLTSGLGQSGAPPGGLGGLANGAAVPSAAQAAQLGQSPGAAIAKSIAAGAGGGGAPAPVAPVSPPTTTGVSSAGSAAQVPSAGASGIAPSSGLGASGAHVAPASSAAAPVSSSAAGGSAAPAMMVPPPGMGAPAAAPGASGAGGAPVVPASTGGGAAGGAGPSSGSGVAPGSGATTMVPTPVATPAAGVGGRTESSDLRTARTLAAQLRRDSDAVSYPIIEWAVGVFRSDSSVTPETVVMSNEGFGYIPRGVYLPRGVRLLSTDPMVHNGFEKRWTGWSDPARTMVEYAAMRHERGGGKLVAAAATNRVEPFRTAGVEYVLCARDNTPTTVLSPPMLDAVHVDRFEVSFPDVSARVDRLAAERRGDLIQEVVKPLTLEMMTNVTGVTVPYPPELRAMWEQIIGGEPVGPADWSAFNDATTRLILSLPAYRPGFNDVAPEDDPTDRSKYAEMWLIARAMELLRSFQDQSASVADMLYPIGVSYDGDFAQRISPLLRELEIRR